jgi:Fic family protein
MLDADPDFEGGMKVRKYISINATTKSTATRDLQDLVAKQILIASGNARNTRYEVRFELII